MPPEHVQGGREGWLVSKQNYSPRSLDAGSRSPTGEHLLSRKLNYGVFTMSPTFAPPAPVKVAVAESSSTSVTVASPILSTTALITLPVAGSFTVRTGRLTSSLSPTFTPPFLPTLIISVLPVTSATNPLTEILLVGILSAASSSFVPVSSTALRVASPRIVFAKLLLPMSRLPPPVHPPPPPSREVPERADSPIPLADARISPVDTLITRAVMPTTAFALLVPTPPRPKRPSP